MKLPSMLMMAGSKFFIDTKIPKGELGQLKMLEPHLMLVCSVGTGSSGGRKRVRKSTQLFNFAEGHSLFSETTRRCEAREKKRAQNIKWQGKYQEKKRNETVKRLKASIKKKDLKIQSLTKKLAKKTKK